jgi:large conductance mechanosensitive channel
MANIPSIGIVQEFRDFLKEYKVMGLAIAFVMGAAVTSLVSSLVSNIIMPLVNPLIQGGGWQTATVAIGPFNIGWGPFLAALLNFLIIAWAVFIMVKFAMGESKVTKK